MKSSLAIRFNVVLLAVLIVAFVAGSLLANYYLKNSVRQQSLERARLLLGAAAASNAYTVKHVVPLLAERLEVEFLPQLTPSLAASQQMREMLMAYPGHVYRQATLNPPNPGNQATGWETEVIEQLREKPQAKELVGERDHGDGLTLFVAQPIQVADAACLICHGSPDSAPKTVTDLYGRHHGFDWQLNEIIGMRYASVPLGLPLQQASERLNSLMLWLLAIDVFLFCALSWTFHRLVARRLKAMADIAERVSLGERATPEITPGAPDDLARMGQSFTRMRTSLACAMNMLEAKSGADHA
ncbi:DUF3365 domain-containing protein [Pseudomonas sp. NPDC089752]|uniref:c-type heme family protein n=1 Tax=Pseudomonas sp. NPDC089752 TaxID=3364472 RepID=UPI00382932BD